MQFKVSTHVYLFLSEDVFGNTAQQVTFCKTEFISYLIPSRS